MPDDAEAEAAQARALLEELRLHVEKVSRKIEIVERRNRRRSARGIAHVHRQQSELRRDLYEAHRLIDGLHRRYPETLRCQRPFALDQADA
ncbi:hypothetical protein H7J06_24725 [Mycobacterium hodleri]|uniref:hypothetical protein n=1 Tax=Mycolicibacterium hodleri TaxID=49897 RepID=UPI0021F373C8|nr:hypothetical protein [Mycolicibacterium hodleri]MCV7136178.1 hypothetical protein [Mycolicibacterium hodleri]